MKSSVAWTKWANVYKMTYMNPTNAQQISAPPLQNPGSEDPATRSAWLRWWSRLEGCRFQTERGLLPIRKSILSIILLFLHDSTTNIFFSVRFTVKLPKVLRIMFMATWQTYPWQLFLLTGEGFSINLKITALRTQRVFQCLL